MTPGRRAQTATPDLWDHLKVDAADQTAPVDALISPEMEPPTVVESRFDRRDLFRNVAAVAGLLGAGAVVAACDMVQNTTDPQLHLLRRVTYGLDASSITRIRAVGTAAWLDEQLDPARLDTSAVEAKVALLTHVNASFAALKGAAESGEVGSQVRLAAVIRQVESPAQLFERMVELWSDHLNVPITDNRSGLLKTIEDRAVIRPRALGRFADLLVASAKSPAMLVYLDNAVSVKAAPNENYARELLELHTVGVGNFTEADVVATARLLTGWTVNSTTGEFVFRSANHDSRSVSMLGWTRPTSGTALSHGEAYLTHLARHPATARMVATKIARRFATDMPPANLIDDLAAVYTANDTAIVPVLRALFGHPAFTGATNTKFRRPIDWVVASARALGATMAATTDSRLGQVGTAVSGMGQLPFGWPAPNGYPDVEGAWLTTGGLLSRWNLAGDLVARRIGIIDVPIDSLRDGLAGRSTNDAVAMLADRVLHEPLTAGGRQVIIGHSGLGGVARLSALQVNQLVTAVVPLLLASPDFQYR